MSISLTKESANVLLSYMNEEKPIPEYVRFGGKAGGCAGFTYTIGFDSKSRKFDLEFESCGVKLLVDKKSLLYVKETEIGWSDELQDKGFKFDNPHAKGACGCKTSFQIDVDKINEGKETPNWIN